MKFIFISIKINKNSYTILAELVLIGIIDVL